MKIFKDFLTDQEVCSDAYPNKEVADGILEIQSEMIVPAKMGEINIGANKSAEGAGDEEVEDDKDDVKVIDIVHKFQLQKIGFASKKGGDKKDKKDDKKDKKDKKDKDDGADDNGFGDFKKQMMQYWKNLNDKFKDAQRILLHGKDFEYDSDSSEAEIEKETAIKKLVKFKKAKYDQLVERQKKYKERAKQMNDWVLDFVGKNIKDCDFYTSTGGAIPESIIIPAVYKEGATAPTFYMWVDGLDIQAS